jgi:UDP-N-acetylglucosamine 1-carboxyvinyltransferase
MKALEIFGGKPLKGEVCISGAKNASMPIIIASILSKKQCTIHNIPHVVDVTNLLKILNGIGTEINISGNHTQNPSKTIILSSEILSSEVVDFSVTSQIRTSVLLLGPILARNGYVKLAKPGGCDIGDRKIDLHLMAMEKLGAKITETNDYIEARAKKLIGCEIEFPMISVGATENTIMASVLAEGKTVLKNIAIEPEIDDLVNFLNTIGAKITKTGVRELTINGVKELSSGEYSVMPDRIEATTYAMLAALTDGEIVLKHCPFSVFNYIHETMQSVGVDIKPMESDLESVITSRSKFGLRPIEIETNPYPLFATDFQPQLMTLLSLTAGQSIIIENIFENRLRHAVELQKLGANIVIDGRKAIIKGVKSLHGGTVSSTDLRAGVALLMAALACSEKVVVERAQYIDRGYQMIVKNIERLGGNINVISQ